VCAGKEILCKFPFGVLTESTFLVRKGNMFFLSDKDAQLRAALGFCHLFFELVLCRQINLLSVTLKGFSRSPSQHEFKPSSELDQQSLKPAIGLHFAGVM